MIFHSPILTLLLLQLPSASARTFAVVNFMTILHLACTHLEIATHFV